MLTRSQSTHEVRVGDVSLMCHVRGRGPLCVVHPGGPGLHWEYLRMPLIERDLTMVYLEPAGTGGSSGLPDGARYDLNTYVDHLAAVVREFAVDPVFVMGHAHGGFVAQGLALRMPDHVAGLILYATAPLADEHTRALAREGLRVSAVRCGDEHAAAVIVDAYDRPPGDGVDDETRRLRDIFPAYFADYRHRQAEFTALRDALRCWPRPVTDFDVRAALSSIGAPTLVLAGVHDFAFGPGSAELFRSAVAGATLRAFEDSGHFPHVEEAERFAHLIREFAGRVSGLIRTGHYRPAATTVGSIRQVSVQRH
ncbi:alpha/beta hydrolase [Winogradskya consettensis]|uniref:Hydrolase n=1 Tax=Winogradskya consettensis TaxID=113560 RepID=A0A919SAL5_9ACTN|nr:alpha/beta hydrolase [Actinoplanes consettensis]GIM68046.1 hydrolase [Actinoplanes consettensis]